MALIEYRKVLIVRWAIIYHVVSKILQKRMCDYGLMNMKEGMCQRKGNVTERNMTHSRQADR
jgi:hypothetical protein